MRCEQCMKVPVCEIHNPTEYILCVESLKRMLSEGECEMIYETCHLDEIMDSDNKWFDEKMFHQFRCTKCGTIYGMFINVTCGGEIKINEKPFNPEDYPDKEQKEDK